MNAVSVKQLRTDLPQILARVEAGETFVIIYRSRPVGEINPMPSKAKTPTSSSIYDLLEKPFGEVKLPRGQTSLDLIRKDRR